jgi:hypothetical protein
MQAIAEPLARAPDLNESVRLIRAVHHLNQIFR